MPEISHGFFGREGGVSTGIYASLNAGPGSSDAPADIAENRARIACALNAEPHALVSLYQIHSADVVRLAAPVSGERPQGDAMVTATPGLALAILTADCAPILLADVEAGVIGAAHAGWKGALAGVGEACVDEMEALGARRARIVAAIGPCIKQASYEVGPEFAAAFVASRADYSAFFRKGHGDRLQFDLTGFVRMRLLDRGVGRVDVVPFDTYSEPHALFSHRRCVHLAEGDYGRNCAAIMLMP
jgi:YfiH family protein